MADFDALLAEARQLPEAERLRLISELWDTVVQPADHPLHEEWAAELDRRVAMIEAGAAKTVPWETARSEALARIGNGPPH